MIERRTSHRIRVAEQRNNETAEETIERRTSDRIRAAEQRNTATAEEMIERQTSERIRVSNSRSDESNQQRELRLQTNALGNRYRRLAETVGVRRDRLELERVRQGSLRAANFLYLKDEAFHYDPTLDYANFPQVNIGRMLLECTFCGAFKFQGETLGLCCSSGKVSLPELPVLPEPLNSLINRNHPKSNYYA